MGQPFAGLRTAVHPALQERLPSPPCIQSKQHSQRLRPARPHEPRDAQDLASPQRQRNGLGLGSPPKLPKLQHRRPQLVRRPRVQVLDVAPHHAPDDLLHRRALHGAGPDRLAVAQHGPPAAQGLAFLQEMADVHDGDAGRRQATDHPEQVLRVHPREAAGGLVHDEDLRLRQQRPGDLHQLLARHRQRTHGGPRRDVVGPKLREGLPGAGGSFPPVDPTPSMRRGSEEDVLLHGEVRGEVQFLVDHRHPGPPGVQGVRGLEALPVEFDPPGVGRMRAGQHLHQGAFPGSILANQGVHLAGLQHEVNAPKRLGGAEGLANPLQTQARHRRLGNRPGARRAHAIGSGIPRGHAMPTPPIPSGTS